MKATKFILVFFLAVLMFLDTCSLSAFSVYPPIQDISWNDDYSINFHFDGAAKYSYSVYVNGRMVWGFGTTVSETITRAEMLPYITTLADDAIKQEGYSGNVSFDFIIYAKDADGKTISGKTTVSKSLKIETVANGGLSTGAERWRYAPVSTADKAKLSAAFHNAYDQNRTTIELTLAGTGLNYDEYIASLVNSAAKKSTYTFSGSLGQVLRFGNTFNPYGYPNIEFIDSEGESKRLTLRLHSLSTVRS